MVTWANNHGRGDQSWTYILMIEGVGPNLSSPPDSDARNRFCTTIPDFASGHTAGVWRPYLKTFPDVLGERAPFDGGVSEFGSLSVPIVDIDDYLTQTLRVNRAPTTVLSADLTTSTTTFAVGDLTNLTTSSVIYIGAEAMRVTTVGASTITVERAYLGTDALPHTTGDSVYLSIPFLRGRRADYYVMPIDGDSWSDARLVGQFVLDGLRWSEDLNDWILEGRSQLKFLDRLVPIQPRSVGVLRIEDTSDAERGEGYVRLDSYVPDYRVFLTQTPLFWVRNGAEVLGFRGETGVAIQTAVIATERGAFGTKIESLSEGAILPQVMAAGNEMRFSPGPTPSELRESGTWTPAYDWYDLCLIIMLSSASDDDGLELVNYTGSGTGPLRRRNYSSLPPGFGLGLPVSLIDWDSWEAVAQRTAGARFPNFFFGDEPEPFGSLITRHFLRPMGAFLATENGTAKIVMPRTPLADATTVTLGPSNILQRRVGKRQYLPRIEVNGSIPELASSVVYLLGPQRVPKTFTYGAWASTFGQAGQYSVDEKAIEIEVPGADDASSTFLDERASARLWRTHRPRIGIRGDFDASLFDMEVGELASVTLEEIPNLSTAARGWSSVTAQMLEKEKSANDEDGAYVAARFDGYGQDIRVRRVTPAAIIASGGVSGNVATVETNRYTHSDAADGLPTNDAAAFTVNDVVELKNLDGTDAGGTTQIVVSVGGDDIELDGDFGGNMAAGLIIVFADYSVSDSQQTSVYAYMADIDTQTIDGTEAPTIYGEA